MRPPSGLVVAITAVSGYGLATRLFPGRLGTFDPTTGYRLSEPIGYWNGLGIVSVIGILLAVGLVLTDRPVDRAIGGFSIVVLPVVLFYTYSRGSWLALAAGAFVLAAVSPRRLRLAGTASLLAPVAALAVLASSRSYGLTHADASLAVATRDGRTLAVVLLALAILAASLAVAIGSIAPRLSLTERTRRALGVLVICSVIAGVTFLLVNEGGPGTMATRAYDSFVAPPPLITRDLNSRLVNLSGNGRADLWRIAWDAYRTKPVLGSGAGSYERVWQADPRASFKVRDAHSLYLEVLQELGPIGLALLGVALLLPLVAVRAARSAPVVPACAGAYSAFLVHAGTDWDWELAGVTLFALATGALLLAAARTSDVYVLRDGVRLGGIITATGLGAVVVVLLLGNTALSSAQSDLDNKRYAAAQAHAARAQRLQPWSPTPWIVDGEALYRLGRVDEALLRFREASRIDYREWRAWVDRAVASSGKERVNSLARARALYPSSSTREEIEAILAKGPG